MTETPSTVDSRNLAAPDADSFVDWTREAYFDFESEVDALTTIQELGDELAAARKHVEHTMRYLRAAIVAARKPDENGEQTSAEALIGHSGLSRRTVYQIIA